MSYYFSKTVNDPFDAAVAKLIRGLKREGFGILREIDVKEKLKKMFNVDFRRYKILEACKPPFSRKALTASNKNGPVLPCNLIVQEISYGRVKVTAIDPLASIHVIENPKLKSHAAKIGKTLETVISRA